MAIIRPPRRPPVQALGHSFRAPLSTTSPCTVLGSNRWIKAFPDQTRHASKAQHMLTLLSTNPPTPSLSIGYTSALPPTPSTFTLNRDFMRRLNAFLVDQAPTDPDFQAYAKGAFSSTFSPRSRQSRPVGGFVHLSDRRRPPEFGRIADPQDILGSIEVDGDGRFVGSFVPSGTYRVVTNDGVLGLSDHLMMRLVESIKADESR